MTFVWVVAFTAMHVPWYLAALPTPTPETATDYVVTGVVLAMFVAGAALPLAVLRPWGRRIPRWALIACVWFGGGLLLVRAGLGLTDLALRATGLAKLGLTGLTDQQISGGTDPREFDTWLGLGVEVNFLLGGALFTTLGCGLRRLRDRRPDATPTR